MKRFSSTYLIYPHPLQPAHTKAYKASVTPISVGGGDFSPLRFKVNTSFSYSYNIVKSETAFLPFRTFLFQSAVTFSRNTFLHYIYSVSVLGRKPVFKNQSLHYAAPAKLTQKLSFSLVVRPTCLKELSFAGVVPPTCLKEFSFAGVVPPTCMKELSFAGVVSPSCTKELSFAGVVSATCMNYNFFNHPAPTPKTEKNILVYSCQHISTINKTNN